MGGAVCQYLSNKINAEDQQRPKPIKKKLALLKRITSGHGFPLTKIPKNWIPVPGKMHLRPVT